ncbi:hypothetical protein LUX29_11885 [Aureimonas altamirensis]|uniref:hypothetical protein n=1 Tax=Aureimonas altamirensis TaxID=370622 RepID=UPI001E4C83E9|nr:hypothetical protein [Aureimonas altamirensis]UHD43802.1 hypothetical protein LUX29_11885 [Aureimonas altamirensis]
MATAQEACLSIDTGLTVVRAQEYAPLIAKAADGTTPEQVEFLSFMQSGNWSVVYAATPVADPGYFFFETVQGKGQFKDVWAGMADPSDRPELIKWAEKLGSPTVLATCFAETAAAE